jgi:hypothetical protein
MSNVTNYIDHSNGMLFGKVELLRELSRTNPELVYVVRRPDWEVHIPEVCLELCLLSQLDHPGRDIIDGYNRHITLKEFQNSHGLLILGHVVRHGYEYLGNEWTDLNQKSHFGS